MDFLPVRTHGGPEVAYTPSLDGKCFGACGGSPWRQKSLPPSRAWEKSENGPASARHVRVKCVSKYFPRCLPPKFRSFVRCFRYSCTERLLHDKCMERETSEYSEFRMDIRLNFLKCERLQDIFTHTISVTSISSIFHCLHYYYFFC